MKKGCSGVWALDRVLSAERGLWSVGAGPRPLCRTGALGCGRWTASSVQNGCSGVWALDRVLRAERVLWSMGPGPRPLCRTGALECGRWTRSSVWNGCSGEWALEHILCVEWVPWSEGAGSRAERGSSMLGPQGMCLSSVLPCHTISKQQKSHRFPILPGGSCSRLATQVLKHICCCSVAKSCLTLCDPMACSTPGFPVLHCLPELAETHVHRVGDTIQPSHPVSSPSPTFSLSQHQGLFQ